MDLVNFLFMTRLSMDLRNETINKNQRKKIDQFFGDEASLICAATSEQSEATLHFHV